MSEKKLSERAAEHGYIHRLYTVCVMYPQTYAAQILICKDVLVAVNRKAINSISSFSSYSSTTRSVTGLEV